MFYYKNKVKAIAVIVAIALLLAVAVSFCMWDDTSLKSLSAETGTGDFTGKRPSLAEDLALGARLEIDGISYTVGHKDTTMITVYSDNVKSKGVLSVYDSRYIDNRYNNYNYTGSEIFASINAYYDKLKDKTISAGSKTYGKVSEYITPHKDYDWNLWLPSAREMNLSGSNGYHLDTHISRVVEGSIQPVMEWYDSKEKCYNPGSYWLRSPLVNNNDAWAFYVYVQKPNYGVGTGLMGYTRVAEVLTTGSTRVALNLLI